MSDSKISPDIRLALAHEMRRLRAYDEAIAARYSEQKMRCPTHLSIGQEGAASALSQILRREDTAVSTHRAHAHYLGKGGDGKRLIAEIYGKVTGCAAGKGGSVHLVDTSVGFKGSTAIVGNMIPVGVGIGLALKLDGGDNVSVVYLGDAAVEEGAFYEAVNFAALKKLPVLFVCENNMYSVYSPLSARQPEGRRIFKMVEAMGVRSVEVDGNDVEATYLLMRDEVARIRETGAP
ncbi:MAG: thiamine pyrophosphate-dependent dehydrogenase E1 component subunit alpha, partial [Bdellovibrionota bacterium]